MTKNASSTKSVRVPLKLIKDRNISAAAQRLYVALAAECVRQDARGDWFLVTIAELRSVVGRSGWAITQRLHELERGGYVIVRRLIPGQPNLYRLT